MSNLLPAWGATEPDIGGTIADALNSVYRQAQFLERVLGFLKTLGDLAPPCAVVPLSEARTEIAQQAAEIRRTLLPELAPEVREKIAKALDELDTKIAKIPTDVKTWVDAPSQWKVGAWDEVVRVPTSALGWAASGAGLSWGDAKDAAMVLLNAATVVWLISVGPAGAFVAGTMYSGRLGNEIGELVNRLARSTGPDLRSVLRRVVENALRFEQRTKPSVYQQVLGVWILTQSSPTPEVMKAGMTNMNPYLLPPMPEVWDGAFDHLARQEKPSESGSWLIALLLGGFLGLSVAALTE